MSSQFKVSERRACRVLGQHRSTQRHVPKGHADEDRLVADMIELARQFGRYGYRRIAALLREAGWSVSDGRIERLWRREGLKVPQKQPKKGRLWLNDGSCVRLRPEYRNHVWSYNAGTNTSFTKYANYTPWPTPCEVAVEMQTMASCEHLAAATRGWAAFDWAEHCLKQQRSINEGDVCARYIWRQWQLV